MSTYMRILDARSHQQSLRFICWLAATARHSSKQAATRQRTAGNNTHISAASASTSPPSSNLLHCPMKTIEALHVIFRKKCNLLSLPVSTFSFTSTRRHFATSGRADTQSNKSKATAQSKVWRKTRWLEYWLCDWCHNSLIGWGLES